MTKIAIFPGSFDPFTRGHLDIVSRATTLFDEIIIGIGYNDQKKRMFDVQSMKTKIENSVKGIHNVKVEIYSNLTADFALERGAKYLLRGIRNTTDFEYENAIAQANKHLNEELETVFLMTTPSLAHISSTIARELYRFNKDVSAYVPFDL
jgi:pantetheine-phosphate adenylyltransferase